MRRMWFYCTQRTWKSIRCTWRVRIELLTSVVHWNRFCWTSVWRAYSDRRQPHWRQRATQKYQGHFPIVRSNFALESPNRTSTQTAKQDSKSGLSKCCRIFFTSRWLTNNRQLAIIRFNSSSVSPQINTICTVMDRGERFDNGSWDALLGMLRNDECDFVVGGFFPDFDVHDDFGVTNTYFQDSYTW